MAARSRFPDVNDLVERNGNLKKGATKHCSWGICKSDSRFIDKAPVGTFFVRFPKPGKIKDSMTEWEKGKEVEKTEKCKRWVHACGRQDFSIEKVKKDTYICSLHFIGQHGPTAENPDPILATLSGKELVRKTSKRKPPAKREFNSSKKRRKATKSDELETNLEIHVQENLKSDETNLNVEETACDEQLELLDETVTKMEKSTQTTDYNKQIIASKVDNVILRNELNLIATSSLSQNRHSCMDMNVILASPEKSMYFIGLTPKHFWSLYNFLGPAKFNLSYWGSLKQQKSSRKSCKLSLPEQLFVTLMRLRRGFNIYTVAHFYDVSEYLIRTVFTTWIMFMFHHFKDLRYQMFPERQAFRNTLPKVFKSFKNIRASIDCTEFKCEMPRNYSQQGNMYSSYKSHCTMKCLIAVNPNGAACFISDLFEGSISDVDIFQQSGIMEHINPNDSFLVDKGFTVQHLLLSKQATIFIPPFLGKREKFTQEEVMLTKRIAKARIHVERFNERLKRFRLLDRIIPLSLAKISSQLVYVGCCLVNFQELLCK